jgi:hypothetical protein
MIPDDYLNDLKSRLTSQAEDVCHQLLGGGKRKGRRWVCGGVDGGAGQSMNVELDGDKAGLWRDAATGEGGDLLTLWQVNQGLSFPEAVAAAASFAGILPPDTRETAPKLTHLSLASYIYEEPPAPEAAKPDIEPPMPEAGDAPTRRASTSTDWEKDVAGFSDEHAAMLCEWRGFSTDFVKWLHRQELIGVHNGCFAFPVHDEKGEVIRIHFKGKDHWQYHPKGGDTAPLLVGAPITHAAEVLVFESQWDAFAMLDKLGAHRAENANRYCAYITRGATSNTNLARLAVPKVIACPQNDPAEKASKTTGRTPAQEWLHRIQTSKHKSTSFSVFDTPPQHKDANDWIRADKPTEEVVTRLVSGAINPLLKGVIRGVSSFPTDIPPEDVLFGDGLGRIGDTGFLNSGAGMGKSVAQGQTSIAFALGLPYLGIRPTRPLKIIHFCGEDDEATIGQCREGFLTHSEEITGRKLLARDLLPLDSMIRTDFERKFTGDKFLARLEEMLNDEHADLILINPLLSFIGGDIVLTVSKFLREGLGPILQRHRCAALIAHHTCKLNRDSWDNMDFTYSGIGGGEVANIPRFILTLAPTKAKGLMAVHASKRTTTGWKDECGRYMAHAYFRRTDNPTRPAWLPVGYEEAEEMIAARAGSFGGGRAKKATVDDLVEILSTGAMRLEPLIESLMKKCGCGRTIAKTVINNARLGAISKFTEKDEKTGRNVIWLCLPEHKGQWVKDELTV